MINWFGPAAWGAPICRTAPRCEVPVGVPCARCGKLIEETDEGVTMPGVDGGGIYQPYTYHLDCHLKSVLPHHMWEAHGLVPKEADGLRNGRLICAKCGVVYDVDAGWGRIMGP